LTSAAIVPEVFVCTVTAQEQLSTEAVVVHFDVPGFGFKMQELSRLAFSSDFAGSSPDHLPAGLAPGFVKIKTAAITKSESTTKPAAPTMHLLLPFFATTL